MELRDYQVEAVDKINEYLRFPRAKVLYQCATGSGKTVVACAIVKEWHGDLYWLTHRRELERQSAHILVESGVENAIVSSPVKMYNKIKRGTYNPTKNSLIIADEAHHASAPTWAKILKEWPGTVLGLTATPWRLSRKEGFDHLFDFMIKGPSVQELVEEGYLVPCIVRHPKDGETIEPGGIVSGDFSPGQTMANNDRTLLIEMGIKWLLEERKPDSSTVCYCLTVQHAEEVNKYAIERGLRSKVILGNTNPVEREEAVAEFSRGELDLLVCVEVITEGFDVPMIDSILILRPTESLSLYLQMIGRSMRPAPGKEYALVLDACNNWKRHGLPEEDRAHIWSLEARSEEDGKGEPPVRVCPRCHTINHAATRACKNCGKSFGKPCKRCGSFVFIDEDRPGECLRCTNDQQESVFAEGVSTIVAGRPYYLHWMTHLPELEKWGILLETQVETGTTVLVTTRKGKRWYTSMNEIVGKNGNSYICTTTGARVFISPITQKVITSL